MKVQNTTKMINDNPLMALIGAMSSNTYIEDQEAQGQDQLVNSDVLPTDINPTDKAAMIKFGIKFLDQVESDSLFQHVELPEGWSRKKSDHSMWSYIIDDKERERISIFYKAAFYDRSASASCNRRFSVNSHYYEKDTTEYFKMQVLDYDKVIYETKSVEVVRDLNFYNKRDVLKNEAREWLEERYPNYEDVSAYWD